MAKAKFNTILDQKEAILIDFHATWCGPCKAMHPILQDVAKQAKSTTKVIKIDIDKNPSIASKYGVRSVPTLLLFKDGDLKWRQSGVVPAQQILQEIQKHV